MTVIEVRHEFDAALWQVSREVAQPALTILVSWTVTPPVVDAGIPFPVSAILAKALLSIGAVLFGGDADPRRSDAIETVPLRRGLRRHSLTLFRGLSREQVLPAFSSAAHDWSMNAQWLIVAGSGQQAVSEEIRTLVKRLYEFGELPEAWPNGVLMIVQAAVDGDGAGCHSANGLVERRFIDALNQAAKEAGADFILDEGR